MDIVVASPGRENKQTYSTIPLRRHITGVALRLFITSSSRQKIDETLRRLIADGFNIFQTPLSLLSHSLLAATSRTTHILDQLSCQPTLETQERTRWMNYTYKLYRAVQRQLLPVKTARLDWFEQFLRSNAPARELST